MVSSDVAGALASHQQLPPSSGFGPGPEESQRKEGAQFPSSEMLSSFWRDRCQPPHYVAYHTLKMSSPSQSDGMASRETRKPEEQEGTLEAVRVIREVFL